MLFIMQYQALFTQNMKPNLSSAAVVIGDLKIYFQDHLWPEFPPLLQNAHQVLCCYSDEIKAPADDTFYDFLLHFLDT